MTARAGLAHRVRPTPGGDGDGLTGRHPSNTARTTREWYTMEEVSNLNSRAVHADDVGVLEAWRTSHPVTDVAVEAVVRWAPTDSQPIFRSGCEPGLVRIRVSNERTRRRSSRRFVTHSSTQTESM